MLSQSLSHRGQPAAPTCLTWGEEGGMGHGPSHHKAQLQLRPHPLSAPALLLPLPSWNSLLSNSQDLDPCCGHCFREADQKSQRGVSQTLSSSRGGWWCLCWDHLFPLSPSSLKDLHLGISKPGPDLTNRHCHSGNNAQSSQRSRQLSHPPMWKCPGACKFIPQQTQYFMGELLRSWQPQRRRCKVAVVQRQSGDSSGSAPEA